MAQKPDLWMPLYFGAYLTDTMHLTTEQHGAYLLLLMACWKHGGVLPNDDAQLAAIVKLPPQKWRKVRPVIEPFWQVSGKGWKQKRLGLELDAARERSAIATENGKKGGRPRKADDKPTDNPTDNLNETKTEPGGKAKHNPQESSVPRPLPIQRPLPEPGPLPSPKSNPVSAAPKSGASDPGRTVPTWNAYCQAYSERYKVEPTRNRKVNGILASFLERVPAEEAPQIAAFYVHHNGQFYFRKMHCVELLLQDAEKLRTEWLTGHQRTETEARQADQRAATGNVFGKLIAEAEEREKLGSGEAST